MLTSSEIIIALGASLLLTALLTSFMNPFFRFRRRKEEILLDEDADAKKKWPNISIIITASNNLHDLKETLPRILKQDYPGAYQVIVVFDEIDKEINDFLTTLDNHDCLYRTFIPQSSRYLSRKKLAVTVGVKAAKYDWILLTEPSCYPNSDLWLKSMARHCEEPCEMVIGSGNFDEQSKTFYRFAQLQDSCYLLHEADNGNPYCTRTPNLLFLKKLFVQGDGYRGYLEFTSGIYEFLVNKYGQEDCLAIATSPESLVTIISPTGKEWRTQQKYFYHAHKHLKRGFHYHLLFFLDNLFIHLYFMLLTGTIAWVVFMLLQQGPSIHVIALLIVAILTLILTLTARYCLARRIINYFGLQIPLWRIPFYEIYIVWHQIKTSIRYCLSNKTDYSTHKL